MGKGTEVQGWRVEGWGREQRDWSLESYTGAGTLEGLECHAKEFGFI